MFRQKITETALTSREANDFFTRVTGDAYLHDVSFISTLRALVYPRMPENELIHLIHNDLVFTKPVIESYRNSRTFIEGYFNYSDMLSDGTMVINGVNAINKEDNQATFDAVDKEYIKVNQGWERLEQITLMYQKQFKVLCFINPEHKQVVLFVESYNLSKHHYLQVSILAMMPWYFKPEQGVTDVEMELMRTLQEKEPDTYVAALSKIAEQYDFRAMRIRSLLSDFETQYERQEREKVNRLIRDCDDKIIAYNNLISECLGARRDYEIRLMGLDEKIVSGGEEPEIMDYFLCNNNISLEYVVGNAIIFVVKSYMEFFDEDMARTVIDKDNSYVYTNSANGLISPEDMRRLMTAIFIDQTIKIRFCAAYKFDMGGRVQGVSAYDYRSEFNTYMPNPHIDAYSCLGSYTKPINELLMQSNYIGAIEQCAASCRSLNFGDSTVMGCFMRNLYGTETRNRGRKYIELPDGSVVGAVEAVEWLKAQEVTNE